MISTVYSGNAVKYAITKLAPDVLVLVVEKDLDKIKDDENVDKKKKAISEIKSFFKGTLEIELLEIKSLYDIYEITKDVVDKIDKTDKDNEIIMHISEGRKPLSFALNFAAYLRNERVKEIYYITAEKNEILKFPIFSFPINEIQKNLLKLINKGHKNTEELLKKSEKSRSVVYQYIKDLESNGFLERENGSVKITELGRLMVL